ncbi:MAG: integrase core domain-containing protein, partial [Polyangiaceae bacterium]|nr:integrase core domain-containing protein [Polyangiaceae bacterium]
WMIATEESASLAKQLVSEIYDREGIEPLQLTLHADRGSAMTSKSFALLLADLGVTKTHSRPHVSNDNPFSESAFKTLKYRPGFPDRFGCLQDAREHCARFFDWYNYEHRHASVGLCTPHQVHRDTANATRFRRASVLDAAFVAHPERFVRGRPTPPSLPTEVWFNKPKSHSSSTSSTDNSAQ